MSDNTSSDLLFSDFMLDPRKTRFEVEFYHPITNKITRNNPVTFKRLSIALGMVLGPLILGLVLFDLGIIYSSSLLVLPFILLMATSVYTARQYLIRVGNGSRLGYAINYLYSGKNKAHAPQSKLRVEAYEEVDGVIG